MFAGFHTAKAIRQDFTVATATTGKLSNPVQLYILNWNHFLQALLSLTTPAGPKLQVISDTWKEYMKAVKDTLVRFSWSCLGTDGWTQGPAPLLPVPGMNIPHIHPHNPLGHEGTTWQRSAVGQTMILSIVRRDCPAMGSNKNKCRVCSVLLQARKQAFSSFTKGWPCHGGLPTHRCSHLHVRLSVCMQDTGYAPAHYSLNIIYLLSVTAG